MFFLGCAPKIYSTGGILHLLKVVLFVVELKFRGPGSSSVFLSKLSKIAGGIRICHLDHLRELHGREIVQCIPQSQLIGILM